MLLNVKSVLSKTNSVDSTSSSNTNSKSNDNVTSIEENKSDIVKCGYLRKYKTMKKKFFVLRAGSESGPARLEYYDNEKRMKSNPKRSIVLQACFNINKKLDSKHKLAIALYTKDDCFSIVPETETEQEEWLTWLLALQQGHVSQEGNITTIDKEVKPKPHFEFMWQISVKNKGLASKSPELLGPRRLCLTSTTLALVKMTEERESLDFPLMGIRRCGHSDCFFFMEVGRSTVTGVGEIWMQTEDTIIAQNMHEAILSAMKACGNQEELGPISRPRSASTSENGKSTSSRQGTVASNTSSVMGSSGSITGACGGSTSSVAGSYCTDRSERNSLTSAGGNSLVQAIRDRCDSMPTRSRTVSEGHHDLGPRPFHFEMLRPHSTYGHMNAYSPPVVPNPLSPSSGGYSDSAGSSLSIDEFDSPSDFHHSRYLVHPSDGTLHTEPTITEENPDDYLSMAPIGLGENMTDSGVVVESRNSTAYSTASTISVASSVASTTSDYLQMEPNQKTPKANSPPTFLNLVSSNSAIQNNVEPKLTIQPTPAINSPSANLAPTEMEPMPLSRKESSGYVEMKSPQSSNPATVGYFMMSPGMVSEDKVLNSKPKDGYVRMNPTSSAISVTVPIMCDNLSMGSPHPEAIEGYICMEVNSLSSSLPKSIPQSGNLSDYAEHMSSPCSNHSFQDTSLSCSPADVEFFPLEKVKSFFPPTDEDEDYIKPVRAYSIGSRPQLRKTHLANHLEQSRVRAYSFGSQLHPSRFRGRSGEGSVVSISGVPHVSGLDWELGVPKSLDSKVSKKSSSAPILPNSTNLNPSNSIPAGPNGGSRVPFHNKLPVSRSSDTRRDDLMEINYDFSSSSSSHSRPVGSQENRRLSIGSLRQRTSTRSSSSALAAALNSHNQLVKNTAKEGTKFHQAVEQTPLFDGAHIVNQRNATSNNILETLKNPIVYPQKPNDYFEMSFGKEGSNFTPVSTKMENIDKVATNMGTMNVAGEYVNLDLSKATWQIKDTQCTAIKIPINELPKESSCASVEIASKTYSHGYVNCIPDQKSVSLTANPEPKRSGQYSEYFAMNFNPNSNKDKAQLNAEKLNPSGTDINRSVIPKIPSPIIVRKSKESDYCPISSCDIAPLSSVFNKKGPAVGCEAGGKINGHKISTVSASCIKASTDTQTLTNSTSSVWCSPQPKLDRLTSKEPEKNNSNNTANVFTLTGSKSSLADVSYENIQIGPSLSSSPSSIKGAIIIEKELNYASLDLPPSVDGEEKVPRTVKLGNGVSSGYQPNKTTESVEEAGTSTLSYAEIDFTKSEGLRNVSGSLREGRV